MQLDNYRKTMDQLQMPEDMDQRLKSRLLQQPEVKQMTKNKLYKRSAITIAVIGTVIGVGIANPTYVSNAANAITKFFTVDVSVKNEKGNTETLELKSGYWTLNKDASKKNCYFSSMKEASKDLGVPLLESKEFYSYEDCIEYYPSLSDDNILKGARLTDKMYAIGDLKDVSIHKKTSEDSNDSIIYQPGKQYQSPISMQVSVLSDADLDVAYQDNELSYISGGQQINMEDISDDAEFYEIPNLGVKAIVFTVNTDGPNAWGLEQGKLKCTSVLFVYNGVEYTYLSAISHDTMKAFLNTLE